MFHWPKSNLTYFCFLVKEEIYHDTVLVYNILVCVWGHSVAGCGIEKLWIENQHGNNGPNCLYRLSGDVLFTYTWSH